MPRAPASLRSLVALALLSVTPAWGCDGGESDESETTTTTTTGGGACMDPAVSTMMCGDDCPFDTATLDCTAACQNVADKCADPSCSASASCQGQNQDVALCAVACEASKGLTCTNITFGCWETQGATDNCEDVGVCFNAAEAAL